MKWEKAVEASVEHFPMVDDGDYPKYLQADMYDIVYCEISLNKRVRRRRKVPEGEMHC